MTREEKRSPFKHRPAPLAKQIVMALGAFPSQANIATAHRFIVLARRGRGRTTKNARVSP